MTLKLRSSILSTAVTGTVGLSLDLGTTQARAIVVDNYSGFWLGIGNDGIFVPPSTVGFVANFYSSSASSILVRKQLPTGVLDSQQTKITGTIIVALYDEPLAPNPGMFVGVGYAQMQYIAAASGGGNSIPADGHWPLPSYFTAQYIGQPSFPLLWTNRSGQEVYPYSQMRRAIDTQYDQLAVLANTLTNTTCFTAGANAGFRLMWFQLTSDTTGFLELQHPDFAAIAAGYVTANGPGIMASIVPDGVKISKTNIQHFYQVRHSAAANVCLSIIQSN